MAALLELLRGLSPEERLMAMRPSLGKLVGGLNAGCSPPMASAKLGAPSHFMRIAISPVSTNFLSSRES